MSIILAGVYYTLIVQALICAVLLVPLFVSWKHTLISKLVTLSGARGQLAYYALLVFVALVFADSFRTATTIADEREHGDAHANSKANQIRYFRAQRNMYLTLMLLVLSAVNKGLFSLNYKLKSAREEIKALKAAVAGGPAPTDPDAKKAQ
ncbi:uncharacterized protein AMSG_01955 [Thecamonas trahens ATCC 50062]|uniref:Endoplasmic reticulum transmembrane protein n=1 Tax=Thecamonas trahens ATCC 50062 TaxID=461836 RepID=A0A0L0DUF5_THETB|nr:hypothetical protein AMSG_01955 [Thecamonas trahens ATCC 50062]KNC55686.1 hypothetical protein AMSG_01955 [Thecamonas trahens ATCC 50062]|eukprot:XP_013761453.1 hypothetical protein AMSG_01955 [Thecamonas trahens ATCC 50062]